jgi:hypothetical protein
MTMAHDQSFFSQARGINTLYCDKEGDAVADVRFCLARHGEDASLVLARFWDEQPSSGFTVVCSPTACRPGVRCRRGSRLPLHLRASR